jgi:hypothetical protein
LDLLDIPRLSNAALAVPLSSLRILAAGSLGRPETAERVRSGEKFPVSLTIAGAQASVGGGPWRKRQQAELQLLVKLYEQIGRPASCR